MTTAIPFRDCSAYSVWHEASIVYYFWRARLDEDKYAEVKAAIKSFFDVFTSELLYLKELSDME